MLKGQTLKNNYGKREPRGERERDLVCIRKQEETVEAFTSGNMTRPVTLTHTHT